ncbi:MAG: DUF3299 domain-containing protein [Pseudohongiella sp.]|nr:DUF3299 domain-containing protein [Pseudohongiella sp.]
MKVATLGFGRYLARSVGVIALQVLLLISFAIADGSEDDKTKTYREIDWVDLMPEEDLQALMNPPAWMLEIEDGSEEDDLEFLSAERELSESDARFMQALRSAEVRPEMHGQLVRLPGFIVPLAFDGNRNVIEFFLVPYFGACLHLPPPPPNQIIYLEHGSGIRVDNLQQPYWVEGQLTISATSNRTGSSAYSISSANIELYTE